MESDVSLRTNVKQSRKVGNGLPRLTARNDEGMWIASLLMFLAMTRYFVDYKHFLGFVNGYN